MIKLLLSSNDQQRDNADLEDTMIGKEMKHRLLSFGEEEGGEATMFGKEMKYRLLSFGEEEGR